MSLLGINEQIKIKELAIQVGFDRVGFALLKDSVDRLEEAKKLYRTWLDENKHADMEYLVRHSAVKFAPELLLKNAKSVIVVALHYGENKDIYPSKDSLVAQYAAAEDYHSVIKNKLLDLQQKLQSMKDFQSYAFVDADPVADRFWAYMSGLGWIGKNTCLIDRKTGSLFFIGGLLTSAELESDQVQPDHCGKCTKCIDACPTQAIIETPNSLGRRNAYVVDSNKCISFHTIESKSVPPIELSLQFGSWIFGCDICQQVCPWNKDATSSFDWNLSGLASSSLEELIVWTAHDFKTNTKDMVFARMKYLGF